MLYNNHQTHQNDTCPYFSHTPAFLIICLLLPFTSLCQQTLNVNDQHTKFKPGSHFFSSLQQHCFNLLTCCDDGIVEAEAPQKPNSVELLWSLQYLWKKRFAKKSRRQTETQRNIQYPRKIILVFIKITNHFFPIKYYFRNTTTFLAKHCQCRFFTNVR